MNPLLRLGNAGLAWSLLFLCCCTATNSIGSQLRTDVAINQEAGRGGFLVVTVRSESGEELPFFVDCGSSGTAFDKSYETKLGKPLGTTAINSWGTRKEVNVYAMPKLYLGGLPLETESRTCGYDFQMPSDLTGRPIAGMLGYDTLRHYCIQLDFAAGKMRFLDDEKADKQKWGKAFPIVALNDQDTRPSVAGNLLGLRGPHALIDSGCISDGWLMPQYFQKWTNEAVLPTKGEARSPTGYFDGDKYPFVSVQMNKVESDGIGLRFLARHLVTLDFPNQTLYLQRQSIGPLPDPRIKFNRIEVLDSLIADVIQEDADAARKELVHIEGSSATELEKNVARKLTATLENTPKLAPKDAPPEVTQLPLGDAQPELAQVGWLKPTANRVPLNGEIQSPMLDSSKIFATGLFAHAPSKYVFDLNGKWKVLQGEAGLHTAFQGRAYGIVFVIKADGKEVFRSPTVRGSDHSRYKVDVAGVRTVELLVEKVNEQNGGNWGLWLDPILLR